MSMEQDRRPNIVNLQGISAGHELLTHHSHVHRNKQVHDDSHIQSIQCKTFSCPESPTASLTLFACAEVPFSWALRGAEELMQ